MRILKHKQQGNLLAAAVIIIVALAIFGLSVIRTVTSTSVSSDLALEGYQSLYLASSGLEYGSLLTKNNVDTTNPTAYCDGNWKATQSFGAGEFHFKCTQYVPSITLTAPINSTALIVPISSTTNVAPIGRVQIDSEQLDYTSVSTSASVCGSAPCLVVKDRGDNNTTAASHSSGATVSQAQLVIQAEGAVPSLTSPVAIKTIQKAVSITKTTYTNAWAVGQAGAVFRRLNGQWQSYTLSPSTTNNLNSVTCPASTNCWIVGDNTTMYQWNGSTWGKYTSATFNGGSSVSLKQVTCLSTTNCWLITSNNDIYQWDGANWNLSTHLGSTVKGISCSGTICVAVGANGTANLWNGTTWSSMTSGTSNDLNAVSCPSATLCFAAGENGTIRKWAGSSWTSQSSPTNKDLYTISCADANNCWAFGTNRDRNANYSGGSWQTKTVAISNKQLGNVYCSAFNQCFLAVNRSNANDALIGIWNGQTWGNDLTFTGSAQNLTSVATDNTTTTTIFFENICWGQVVN